MNPSDASNQTTNPPKHVPDGSPASSEEKRDERVNEEAPGPDKEEKSKKESQESHSPETKEKELVEKEEQRRSQRQSKPTPQMEETHEEARLVVEGHDQRRRYKYEDVDYDVMEYIKYHFGVKRPGDKSFEIRKDDLVTSSENPDRRYVFLCIAFKQKRYIVMGMDCHTQSVVEFPMKECAEVPRKEKVSADDARLAERLWNNWKNRSTEIVTKAPSSKRTKDPQRSDQVKVETDPPPRVENLWNPSLAEVERTVAFQLRDVVEKLGKLEGKVAEISNRLTAVERTSSKSLPPLLLSSFLGYIILFSFFPFSP